jgi:GH15 family glucan-1,4-alpha-glucosidase
MSQLNLAVIGNCTFGALIDPRARVVWSCMPRFDSDPAFCALLGGDQPDQGLFDIELIDFESSEQTYRANSAVLETRMHDKHGGALEVIDFAPRFTRFERLFRPSTIMRIVRPLSGSPRIRIRLRPMYDYGRTKPDVTRGSNHIRYVGPRYTIRLTSDASLSYVVEEVPFILDRQVTLMLGSDEPVPQALAELSREWLERTDGYWRDFCRGLSIPFEWQDAVMRAAITLKLCNYEDTGAIIAGMTTSVPEAPDTQRNWDYRYCWLRDAYFVVNALNQLGATHTMELHLEYIQNIVATASDGYLQPVFGILRETDLTEVELDSLPGYRGNGPVRVGNGAYVQVQNDGYGSVILACAQSYFDHRVFRPGGEALFHRLELLGEQAARRWNEHDAGLWELRTRKCIHTYSSVMCWVACDRLAKIATQLGHNERHDYWRRHADKMRKEILEQAWNRQLNSFTAVFGGDEMDASLLLLPWLGFVAADDPRFLGTLAQVEKSLLRGGYMFRYVNADDFGKPKTAFVACTFWYIDALTAVGRRDEARTIFETMLSRRNPLGLLSEDIDVNTGELWGNFPQTYSMVGLIQSAMRLSRPWEGAF